MVTPSTHPDRTPVAKDIFTYCTREKIETWHVVICHNAVGMVERVKCKSCHSEHNYRSAAASKTAAKRNSSQAVVRALGKSAPMSRAALASKELEDTWYKGVKGWGEKAMRAFAPSEVFVKGEVLTHVAFGKGVVQVLRGNKMDVLFRDGLKTLPCKKVNI